jgi:hypothetical protein
MTKKILTAYGNCQADALARVLMDYPEFLQEFVYRPIPPIHLMAPADLPRVFDTLASCELLLYQNVFALSGKHVLTTSAVLEATRASALKLSMSPSLLFYGYTPHLFSHAEYRSLYVNEHDAVILSGFLRGIDPATILAVLQDVGMYDAAFSRNHLEQELTAIEKRERFQEVDLHIGDFLQDAWRTQRLYDGALHPRRIVLEHLAQEVLQRQGLAAGALPRPGGREVLTVVTPAIYRSTYVALQLSFPEDFDHCLTTQGRMPLAQVVEQMLTNYAWQDTRALAIAAANQRPFVGDLLDVMLAKHERRPSVQTKHERQVAETQPITLETQVPGLRTAFSAPTNRDLHVFPQFCLASQEADLLVAAMSPSADQAAAAWRRWQAAADLDQLPDEQLRLLPKLHAGLVQYGLTQTADPRIAGVHRRAWYLSQRNKVLSQTALALLHQAGIPAISAGDEAAATVYAAVGERPIRQVQLWTSPTSAADAAQVLEVAGWRSDAPRSLLESRSLRSWRNETLYRRGSDETLRLEWHFLAAPIHTSFEGRFVGLAFDRETAPAQLTREALLAQAAATATQGGPDRLLALGDASAILLAEQPLNWDAVLELAFMLQVARPLHTLLATVSALFDLPVDQQVLARLAALGEDELPHESLRHAAPGAAGWQVRLDFHRRRWRRIAKATKTPADARSLLAYVQAVAGAARPRDLPARLWMRWTQRPAPRRLHTPSHTTAGQQSDGR